MANEATVRVFLQVNNGNQQYRAPAEAFHADMTGDQGPTPGSFLAATAPGTDVDLSHVGIPGGLVKVKNIDTVNFVSYGPFDPDTGVFYFWGELRPGESFVWRMSRFLGGEEVGTGTSGSDKTFRFVANAQPCQVLVEAFSA